jgi:hypothetical protein
MKEIFKKIEGRKWDRSNQHLEVIGNKLVYVNGVLACTLPDLLANKSFTDACGLTSAQCHTAFTKLRLNGEQNCIDYIKLKMI